MLKSILFLILCICFGLSSNSFSQSFGFGCIGFTGGYGGYSFQKYHPNELNEYINVFNQLKTDSLTKKLDHLGNAQGLRFGVNFFRKKINRLFITTKGFYQLLIERHGATQKTSSEDASTSFETKLTTWGLGFDIGILIVSFLDWKIIDAAVIYNQAKFSNTQNLPGSITIVNNYKSDFAFSYSIGTGIIIELFGEYVTIEGSAFYTALKIGEMRTDNELKLTKNENSAEPMKNFISDGGLNALIQLNIGIPL